MSFLPKANEYQPLHYSGTSNNRPSEKGTTSLQRTLVSNILKVYMYYIFNFRKKDRGAKWLVPGTRKFPSMHIVIV